MKNALAENFHIVQPPSRKNTASRYLRPPSANKTKDSFPQLNNNFHVITR